MLLAIASTR